MALDKNKLNLWREVRPVNPLDRAMYHLVEYVTEKMTQGITWEWNPPSEFRYVHVFSNYGTASSIDTTHRINSPRIHTYHFGTHAKTLCNLIFPEIERLASVNDITFLGRCYTVITPGHEWAHTLGPPRYEDGLCYLRVPFVGPPWRTTGTITVSDHAELGVLLDLRHPLQDVTEGDFGRRVFFTCT